MSIDDGFYTHANEMGTAGRGGAAFRKKRRRWKSLPSSFSHLLHAAPPPPPPFPPLVFLSGFFTPRAIVPAGATRGGGGATPARPRRAATGFEGCAPSASQDRTRPISRARCLWPSLPGAGS